MSWKLGLTVWWSQRQHAVFSWDFWILVQSWIRPKPLQLNTLLAINTQAPLQPTVTASSPELCLCYPLHPLTTWQQAWLSWNQWVRTWDCETPHQRHTYSTVTSCLLYKHKDASARILQGSTDLRGEQPLSTMPVSVGPQNGSGSSLSAMMHLWLVLSSWTPNATD